MIIISINLVVERSLNEFETQGKTAIAVAIDDKLSGIFAIADTIKNNAKQTIDMLKSKRIEVVIPASV